MNGPSTGRAPDPSSAVGFRALRWAALRPLAWGYAGAVKLRSWVYDAGLRPVHALPVPVLCVGNLVAGGTGKTPFVAWLARALRERGRRPGILARGYGGAARPGETLNDEGLVLRHILGREVPQHQQADRVRGGRRLLADHPEVDVVLLDDGFQHRRLKRDLDIVLLDATAPFGGGAHLPYGRLRESPAALARAGAVVITRSELLTPPQIDHLRARLKVLTQAPVACARTHALGWSGSFGVRPADALHGHSVFLCSGIGNPRALERFVETLGVHVQGHMRLADHQAVGPEALVALAAQARAAGAATLLLTRKDAVKYEQLPDGVSVLDVETRLVEGEDALWERIHSALARS